MREIASLDLFINGDLLKYPLKLIIIGL